MNLKNLSANKGLILNDLKRYWWTILIQLLIFIISVPYMILRSYYIYGGYMRIMYTQMLFLGAIIGGLMSLLIFSYMHKKQSNVTMHSLPIKKECIYNSHILSAIILMVAPILINLLITIPIILGINHRILFENITLLHFLTFLVELTAFIITSAMASFTGFTIAQGVFSAIISVLSIAIGNLVDVNLGYWLYGYSQPYFFELNNKMAEILSPMYTVVFRLAREFPNLYTKHIYIDSESVIYSLVVILVFYIIGLIAYKKRAVEKCETLITFKWVEPIIKYGFVLSIMLTSIILVKEMGSTYVIITYFVSALIAYLVAQVIIKKDINAIKNVKGYFLYAIFIVIFVCVMKFDIFNYENTIPKLNNIESVVTSAGCAFPEGYEEIDTYRTSGNIANIQNMHKSIIKNRNNNYVQRVYIKYKLKNNKTICRLYWVTEDVFDDYSKKIHSTDEYKSKQNKKSNQKPTF